MKKSKKLQTKKLFILLFVFYGIHVFGQQNFLVDYPSPNAASLGLYGQIPVSSFTGVPDISIPIHTIKMQELELPIALKYHVGSVKPDIQPGWVGLGWALEAGGSISRVVKGRKDEMTASDIFRETGFKPTGNPGYYFHANQLVNEKNWDATSFLNNYILEKNEFKNYYIDLEPDEFIFNFAGMSGSFFYNGTESGKDNFKVKSKQLLDLDISAQLSPASNTVEKLDVFKGLNSLGFTERKLDLFTHFSKFTIIDQHGIKYEFGGNQKAIDYTTSFGSGIGDCPQQTAPTTWYLTAIIFPSGEKIEFNYVKEGDFCVVSNFRRKYCVSNTYYNNASCSYSYQDGSDDNLAIQHLSYLESIKTSKGESVYFKTSPSDELEYDYRYASSSLQSSFPVFSDPQKRYLKKEYGNYKLKLDTIWIQNGSNKIKHVQFAYSNESNRRLRLGSISTGQYSYQFAYNSPFLPDYNVKESDNWGFYNGLYYGNRTFPNLAERRIPNAEKMKAETLSEIIYPTGGSSEFTYEPHSYSKVATQYAVNEKDMFSLKSESNIAGGLRIKKIISFPDKSNRSGQIVREFLYVLPDNKTSSGILSGKPIYETNMSQYYAKKNPNWFSKNILGFKGADYVVYMTEGSENFLNPLGNTNGAHVTYSRVVEKFSDGSSSTYTYINHEDQPDECYSSIYTNAVNSSDYVEAFTSRELARGLLKSEVHRNSNNVVVDSTYYQYDHGVEDFVKSISIRRLESHYDLFNRFVCTKNYIFTPKLVRRTNMHFGTNGSSVKQENTYSYNFKNLLSQSTELRTDGKKITTKYIYPFELDPVFFDISKKMTDKHIFSKYIDRVVFVGDASNDRLIEAEFRYYTESKSRKNCVLERVDLLQSKENISVSDVYPFQETSYSLTSGYLENFIEVENADSIRIVIDTEVLSSNYSTNKSNSLSVTDGKGKTVYQKIFTWKKSANSYLSKEIVKIKLPVGTYKFKVRSDMPFSGFCSISLPQRKRTIMGDLRLKPEIYYKYNDRGNIIELKSARSDMSVSYLWGYNYRYPIAEIKNASYEDVKNKIPTIETIAQRVAPTTADMDLINKLRIQLPNALITTYTYKPLVGIQTVIDPRGVETSYNYDSFGRLLDIRDEKGKYIERYDYHYVNQ